MPNNRHHYLRNEQGSNEGFKKKRGFKPAEPEEEEEDNVKIISREQKTKLRRYEETFLSDRQQRKDGKTLSIPENIDLVQINFFTVFNLDLQKKFFGRYGLSVIEYKDFNKTVLFEITNEEQFNLFLTHIRTVFESDDNDSYEGRLYNLIALIYSFEFLNTQKRLGIISAGGYLISLISSANRNAAVQRQELLNYLDGIKIERDFSEASPDLIEVKDPQVDQLRIVADNFDIVRLITSSRPTRIRPGTFGGVRREYGFTLNVPENLPIIGIIDSGISNNIEPLKAVITNIQYDHTGLGAYWDEIGHGTMVAALIALGDEFQINQKAEYTAKARLAIIKVIHDDSDAIDIPRLLNDIKDARHRYGIRIFNMSLNLQVAKTYNGSYSSFAYELDKLAFEEDILIFTSVGNYDKDELKNLLEVNTDPSHEYPSFFYDLNSQSIFHKCWFTNIQEPSESLNNISVGALAGNVEANTNHDITPASEYPAYYTRKFHYDYLQKINETEFKRNQKNRHLNKPDLVFDGGDLFREESGIEVIRSPLADTDKYFARSSGTSLATPLITSKAAQILQSYPGLRTQTVKALLINSASSIAGENPPAFKSMPKVYKKLTGFGKPKNNNLIVTDDNTAVFIVEDYIEWDELMIVPIKLPDYIARSGNKLEFTITLCYSFLPLKNNHLNYLPLHISLCLVKNVDVEIIAKKDAPEYRIKKGFSWSEDTFGIENRLFSNVQKKRYNLQSYDVSNLNNEVSIAIRCIGKSEIPESHLAYLKNTPHPFSLVISISEIPEAKASGQLYNEIVSLNTLENIGESEGSIEIELT